MWRKMKWRGLLRAGAARGTLAALLLSAVGLGGVLWAAKPPAPPPPPGVIYFQYPDAGDGEIQSPQVWVMNAADGSGKAPATPINLTGRLSHKVYQDPTTGEGYRWFVRVADNKFGDPDVLFHPRLSVFRTTFGANGQPNGADVVLLTDLIPLGILPSDDPSHHAGPQFPNDGSDDYIWFKGYMLPPEDSWAIFRIPFMVDPTTGEPSTGATPELVAPLPHNTFRFSAFGDNVVYQIAPGVGTQLWVAGVGVAATQVYQNSSFQDLDPQWSPWPAEIADPEIAFAEGRKVKRLNPATGQVATVYTVSSAADPKWPFWSPNGQHLVFRVHRSSSADIWRVPAAGGSAVNLTNDIPINVRPVGWRD
jgi:hypothetical protein